METHKMLKEICDKIGYELFLDGDMRNNYDELINERDIIFTPEFMQKLSFKLPKYRQCEKIIYYLEKPTLYLYNLLELGEKTI